ncbi:MAG: VRR-NUC domain-containing protein [Marinoscillum sp.]
MAQEEKIILPPKYYLDYFKYLLDFIQNGSSHLLNQTDRDFLDLFNHLSEDAQCLMVRMMNRKGEYFRLEKFKYEEIENIPQAAEELVEAEIISLEPPEDFILFRLFTKSELHHLYPDRDFDKKYKEDILLELAEENASDDYQTLNAHYSIMHFLRQEQIEYFKLLFFGHAHGMMTEFVIRDIGNVKLENLDDVEFTPWFDYEEEARSVFELYKWDRTIRHAMPVLLPEEIAELVSVVNWSDFLNHPKSRKIGDRFMLRLGEYFEKAGLPEEAITYYSLARKHPARERRIRIHEKLDQPEAAREIAEVALESPYNASERIFAEDYLAKKSKRNYRSTTVKINSSPEIIIENPQGHRVEVHALSYYADLGYEGTHSENYLWRGLFGLVFWEELFGAGHASFHHPLQRMPSDLHSEAFYENRKIDLENKISRFKSKKALIKHLEQTYQRKENINNHLVGWHENLLPTLEACVSRLPLKGLSNVLMEISKNVKDNSAGFPDLFIWKDKDYQFYEIKSPNDHLSAQQLFWIDFMNKQKIKADILRVRYH